MGQTSSAPDMSAYALKSDIPSESASKKEAALKSKWADDGTVSGDVNVTGTLKVNSEDISTKFAPFSGSVNYAPATGSAIYATKAQLENYAPASGSANYASKATWGDNSVNKDININSNVLYLRKDDQFNYVKYSNDPAGTDGVVIAGANGGRLMSNAGKNTPLSWNASGVQATGTLKVNGTDVVELINAKVNTTALDAYVTNNNWANIQGKTVDCSGEECNVPKKISSLYMGGNGSITFQDQYHRIHHEPNIDGVVVRGWNGGELRYADQASTALKWTADGVKIGGGNNISTINGDWLRINGGNNTNGTYFENGITMSDSGGIGIGIGGTHAEGNKLSIGNWRIYQDADGSLVFKDASGRGARLKPNPDPNNPADTNMWLGRVGDRNQMTDGNWAKN